jgi:O-antigen/teichoic acid export membrane protein
MLGGAVFYLGASSALARSYYDYDEPVSRRRAISTAFWLTLAGGAALVLLGTALGRTFSVLLLGDSRYGAHVSVAMTGSALTFLNGLFFLLLRFERRSLEVVALNLGALVLSVGLIWYLLAVPRLGVMAPLLGGLLAQAVLGIALFALARRQLALGWSRRELSLQLRFGLASVGLGVAYYALDSADRFLISRLGSLADVGLYSLGYKVGTVITVLMVTPFAQIWSPMRMEYRRHPESSELLTHMLTYYLMVGLLFTVLISVFAHELLEVVAGRPEYLAAASVIPLVMLAHLCYGLINLVDYGLWIERKVHYNIGVFAAGLVINVALNVLLLPRWGYLAAAFTKLATYLLVVAAVFVISHRLVPMRVERRVLWLVLSAAAAVATGVAVGPGGPWGNAVKGGLVLTLAAFWYVGLLRGHERSWLRGLARSISPSPARGPGA